MPLHAEGDVDTPKDELEAKARTVLRKWHVASYQPEEDRAGVFSISAERGYSRELMNLLFHIGLVGMIVAFAAGRMVFYEGQVIMVTESESQYAVPVEQPRQSVSYTHLRAHETLS